MIYVDMRSHAVESVAEDDGISVVVDEINRIVNEIVLLANSVTEKAELLRDRPQRRSTDKRSTEERISEPPDIT